MYLFHFYLCRKPIVDFDYYMYSTLTTTPHPLRVRPLAGNECIIIFFDPCPWYSTKDNSVVHVLCRHFLFVSEKKNR